jgi:uncharacterized protein
MDADAGKSVLKLTARFFHNRTLRPVTLCPKQTVAELSLDDSHLLGPYKPWFAIFEDNLSPGGIVISRKFLRNLLSRSFVLTGVISPVGAQGASFDCAQAVTVVEQLICDNPELSQLDERYAALYNDALARNTSPQEFRETARAWIQHRNECTDAQCLGHAYKARIEALDAFLADSVANQTPAFQESDATQVPLMDKPEAPDSAAPVSTSTSKKNHQSIAAEFESREDTHARPRERTDSFGGGIVIVGLIVGAMYLLRRSLYPARHRSLFAGIVVWLLSPVAPRKRRSGRRWPD